MKHCLLILAVLLFASILAAQPSIDAGGILNVSSAQPTLAPNVVFVIYGKNLGPATIVVPAPAAALASGGRSTSFAIAAIAGR